MLINFFVIKKLPEQLQNTRRPTYEVVIVSESEKWKDTWALDDNGSNVISGKKSEGSDNCLYIMKWCLSVRVRN